MPAKKPLKSRIAPLPKMLAKGQGKPHPRAPQAGRRHAGHSGRKLKNEGTRMACPHCQAQAEIRTSRMVSSTMRELIYACTNAECGHTFVAVTEIMRTLSPSATPDPAVKLPLSSHVQRRIAQDSACTTDPRRRANTS